MAGTAKTSRFNLGSATLMIGQPAELKDLLPATHSVGLVKNFSLTAEPAFADLTQGSKNTVVWSANTSFPVRGSTEVYEYTAANMAYALGLDGSNYDPNVVPVDAPAVAIDDGDTVIAVDDASIYTVDDYIMIYDTTVDDAILVRKIVTVTTGGGDEEIEVDVAVAGNWAIATTAIKIVNAVDVGSTVDQPTLCAKVTGKLADGTRVEVLMPKVRITKGFTLGFNSEQYSNMPFEFELLDLLPTDPFYAEFKKTKSKLFTP